MKPLCIDLFCGLGGWTEGFLAEGYECVGFDVERHDYGLGGYPGQLVLQDVRTIRGSQFRNAAVIVASPPCQEYSYMAMPWSRAKRLAAEYRDGTRNVADLTALFDACFRIQREASEAAGHHIPMVVENVRGAQSWVGRAAWRYGSFYFWGDVPALMPSARSHAKIPGQDWDRFREHGETSPHWRMEACRVPGFNLHEHEKTRESGRSLQPAAVKAAGDWFGRGENCSPMRMREEDYQQWLKERGIKQAGLSGPAWFDHGAARHGSASHARKAASALIAKIPFVVSSHIARTYKPAEVAA